MVDARNLPNDQFGYSVYTVVALAKPEQISKVSAARKAIGLTRATIDAHVTIRGTFHTIENLDSLGKQLSETADKQSAARVVFDPEGWTFIPRADGLHLSIMRCETTPDLLALNKAFDAVVRPQSTNAYPDDYRAHLTLCQDCTDEQLGQARTIAAKLDIGTGFDVRSVQLMGRVGPAFGGVWELIESFEIGS